ncbi:MAG: glycosyltransferase family 4 protein [Porphyromonadaceae bacterium]|jgi:glycosyltransferase involved in cell wall biosynthesis|nr:glycosyltransferase family 4 protein [Porphyromonadaceae bacterium]
MKHKTDLVIVTNEPFPIGMAATNRIISYAKEIAKKKRVCVLVVRPTEIEKSVRNNKKSGNHELINFKYLSNNTIWPKQAPKYKKAIILLKSYLNLLIELTRTKPKAILLVSNDLKLIWYLWFIAKIIRCNYYQEKSEKPPVLKYKFNLLYKKFYLFSYRLFSGLIVMTYELKKLFESLHQNNIFHLPMTVDIERFQHVNRIIDTSKIIFKYCGGGNFKRDGLQIMIESFVELNKSHANFEFHIIGPINKNDEYTNKALELIKISKSDSSIYFIGEKKSTEIPKLLTEADFLIMAPPENFSSGGFPTKLGEYLATGKPVICTSVSEVPLYLNNTNSIIIKPNNKKELIDVLSAIIQAPMKYEEIGKNGRLIAEKIFNINTHSESLIAFLKI